MNQLMRCVKSPLIAGAFLAVAYPAFGSDFESEACKNVNNSLAVVTCATAKKNVADSRLNESYQELMARVKSQYKNHPKIEKDYLSMIKNLNWHGYL
ncbi:hypothetical protein [Pseudomonas sp. MH10]|uniref:lysozyme inhibitor LprI family protein n=1 Tax=Pseudomonas sp. MH10 TaxID=3048627 RepID=UPI002B226BC4|nr:hypothetical protein [Pseudomonas sp. MH10]MEB0042523.1 hypothetical protein [Pseudomonas sp. MH10]